MSPNEVAGACRATPDGAGSGHARSTPDDPTEPSRPPELTRPRAWRNATMVVLGAFALSRVLARAAGVRFDTSTIPNTWQLADPALLADDPFGTAWSVHTQPPLYNATVGAVLRWSPINPDLALELVYLALGGALVVGTLELVRALGGRPVTAVVATVVVTCSPAAILFESWSGYTYPTAVLLTGSCVALARWVRSGRVAWFLAFCGLITATTLLRSLFHPLWLVVILLVCVAARPPAGRRAVVASGLGILVVLATVGAVVVRNQALTGMPGTSSWSTMNLARVVTDQIPLEERQRLVDEGTLSPLAVVGPFREYDAYAPHVPPCTPTHVDDPVLAEPRKSDGHVNFAYECFIPIYETFGEDVVNSARRHPEVVARTYVAAWHLSLMPSSDYMFLAENRDAIAGYDRLHRSLVLVSLPLPPVVHLETDTVGHYRGTVPTSATIVIAFLAVLVVGAQALRRWRRVGAGPATAVAVHILVTTVVVLVVGNAAEVGENHRFRWVIEPMMLAVLAVAIQAVVDRVRGRLAERTDPNDDARGGHPRPDGADPRVTAGLDASP